MKTKAEIVTEARNLMPSGFYEASDDAKVEAYLNLVLADINVFPPATSYTLDTIPVTIVSLVEFGGSLFAELFWQMKASLQDFSYSDQGLTVNVSQVTTVGQSYVNMFEMYKRMILNHKKTVITSIGGKGLTTPRYQCLTGDVEILLFDNTVKTLKELYDEEVKDILVYSVSPKGKIVPGVAQEVKLTRRNARLLHITLDNRKSFECTPDHEIMLKDGRYGEVKDLKIKDSLMPFKSKVSIESIEEMKERQDTYDLIESKPYHNFVLGCGVIASNSQLSSALKVALGSAFVWSSSS